MNFQPLAAEEAALENRLTLLSGEEWIRGTPFDAVRHVLRERLGPKGPEQAGQAAGIENTNFNMFLKYPLKDFITFERAAARLLVATIGTFDEAIFQLGGAAVDVFFDSVAGKTMKLLAGKEPHRLLSAVPNGYSVLVSHGTRDYKKTGDRSGVFTFTREYLGPVHTAGIFDAAFRTVYNMPVKIKLEQTGAIDFRYTLDW